MKKGLDLALALLFSLSIACCGGKKANEEGPKIVEAEPVRQEADPARTEEKEKAAPAGRFYCEDYGFSVLVPPGWEVHENYMGAALALVSPPEDYRDNFRESAIIAVQPVPPRMSTAMLADSAKAGIGWVAENTRVQAEGTAWIDNRKANWVTYTGYINNTKTYIVQYFLIHEGKGYTMTCVCDPVYVRANQKIFDTMAKSMRIEDKKFHKRR